MALLSHSIHSQRVAYSVPYRVPYSVPYHVVQHIPTTIMQPASLQGGADKLLPILAQCGHTRDQVRYLKGLIGASSLASRMTQQDAILSH